MNRKSKANLFRSPCLSIPVLGLLAVTLLSLAAAQDSATKGDAAKDDAPKVVNAEAAKLKNPLTSDEPTIEAGREVYLTHCASCHGKKGKGDGGQALGGGIPSDLTDDSWDFGGTDGEIFWVIKEGIESNADMLAYKNSLSEKEMWQIVVFIRSIGPKKK